MPLSRAAAAELLSAVPLFSHCSKRELATVARLATEARVRAGHTLMREEETSGALYFFVLVEGAAEVRRKRRLVARLGPGDFFGELALILRRPRTATVTLTELSRLLRIAAQDFKPLLLSSPAIQFKLLEALAERSASATRSVQALPDAAIASRTRRPRTATPDVPAKTFAGASRTRTR